MTELSLSTSLVVFKPDFLVLERTLLALQGAADEAKCHYMIHFELTLVDNSSDVAWHDRIQKWVNKHTDQCSDWTLRLLQAPGNIGYGRGNNLVIVETQSNYHLVINPDLFVAPDALTQAIRFMESSPDVGLLTPAVFGEGGEQHYLCKHNPTLFIMFLRGLAPAWLRTNFKARLDAFEMRECNYDAQIEAIPFPTGCFMFFRTVRLREIGGFDDSFFLYFEDADIGRRMLQIARVVYMPMVKVTHRWSRDAHRNWQLRWVFIGSALIYWKKWGGIF